MGGASAVSNITLLIIFDLLFKRWLSAEGVYAASAVVGLAVTYVLQRRFVWRSRAAFHREAPKFFTVAGVMFVVNLGCISVFVGHLKFPLIATQCVLMAALSGITFLSSKYWTFRT
jgi:putative flippase GtrA